MQLSFLDSSLLFVPSRPGTFALLMPGLHQTRSIGFHVLVCVLVQLASAMQFRGVRVGCEAPHLRFFL